MSTAARVLASILAGAMVVISLAVFLAEPARKDILMLWFFFAGIATAYAVMAIAYWRSGFQETATWFSHAITGLSLSTIAAFPLAMRSEISSTGSWLRMLASVALGVAAAGAAAYVLRTTSRPVRGRGGFAPVFLASGALLTLATLFFKIGLSEGSNGWAVLTRQDHWVTHYASVGQSAFLGGTIHWLQPIFGPVGYAFYALGVVGSAAVLVWLVSSHFGRQESIRSEVLLRLTALVALISTWVLADIFWGWHYDLSDTPWLATLGAVCWLSSILLAAIFVAPIARGRADAGLVRALMVLQLPLLAFNAVMLPFYMAGDESLPGLGLVFLIIGLQVQTWASLYMVVPSGKAETMVPPLAAAA